MALQKSLVFWPRYFLNVSSRTETMMSFNLYNILLYLVFALQLQGASVKPSEAKLFLDECVISQFGETTNLNALITIIKKASFSKLVDAIIDCPSQMLEVLFEDYSSPDSIISLDRLVRYVRGSQKIGAFYSALRNLPNQDIQVKSERTRQKIYTSSFIFDIPSNYYLDILKQNTYFYYLALKTKSPLCRTSKCKQWLTGLMNDLITFLEQNPIQPDLDLPFDLQCIKLRLKLLNNQDITDADLEPFDESGIVMIAIFFGRYDVAEKLSENCDSMDLDEVLWYDGSRCSEFYEDPARSYKIMRKLLDDDEDRKKFDDYVAKKRLNTPW